MEEIQSQGKFPHHFLNSQKFLATKPKQRLKSYFRAGKQIKMQRSSDLSSLMIKINISSEFDEDQFRVISSMKPEHWIQCQKQLLKTLKGNKKTHQKYFETFKQNHKNLQNWYYFATKYKAQISPYVFKQFLIQQKQQIEVAENFNNARLKQTFQKQSGAKTYYRHSPSKMIPQKNQQQVDDQSNDCLNESSTASFMLKPTVKVNSDEKKPAKKSSMAMNSIQYKQEVLNTLFNNALEMVHADHKRKPLNLKLYQLRKKPLTDSHQLYLNTFDACNGRKFIFYDYEKHMKGQKQMSKYNNCVRQSRQQFNKQNYIQNSTKNENLTQFEQFEQQKRLNLQREKCSLLPINLVLNQKQLNNGQGIKKIISEARSNKVVFVNHQGKPITYYIKKNQKNPSAKSNRNSTSNQKRLLFTAR